MIFNKVDPELDFELMFGKFKRFIQIDNRNVMEVRKSKFYHLSGGGEQVC